MIHFLYNFYLTQKNVNDKNRLFQGLYWSNYKYLKNALCKYHEKLRLKQLEVNLGSEIIVSLTSFPARINIVHLSVKSILNQTYKPKKVVLWLSAEQFPNQEKELPKSILELKKCGLEIEFCEDIKPHTKYLYAFKKYPKDLIVTIDDDIFYPRDVLEKLFVLSHKNPSCIIANRVREISFEENRFKPYRDWKINQVYNSEPSKKLIPTGVGGVLYRPSFFSESLFDIENIKKICLNADDIWLRANSLKNDVSVVFTNYYFYPFIEIPTSQEVNLHTTNVFLQDNDKQIKEVFAFLGINQQSFQ
ncbi:MAG: hypothetical protein V4670_09455 [Bacteroidota bacterium]